MSLLKPRQDFQPSCPSGGTWYSCGYGSMFVGCCRSEACENGCPAGNLEPASFNPAFYGDFPDQECSAGQWYTCAAADPPFMGCCKSNPCDAGSCPSEDLAAGFLSNDDALAASFSPTGGVDATSATSMSSTASSTSTATSDSTAESSTTVTSSSATASDAIPGLTTMIMPTSTPASSSPASSTTSHKAPIGAIIGAVIGGVVAIGILVSLVRLVRSFSRSRAMHQNGTSPEAFLQRSVGEVPGGGIFKDSSPPPPSYTTGPFYTPKSVELPGSPGHKRNPSELSRNTVPAELDASGTVVSNDNRRWTQNTARTELAGLAGLGISHSSSQPQFSPQLHNPGENLQQHVSDSHAGDRPRSSVTQQASFSSMNLSDAHH